MTKYIASGSVRGDCGHRHSTISGAVRCCHADSVGCARQGGYSDREVVREDGEAMDDAEIATLHAAYDGLSD